MKGVSIINFLLLVVAHFVIKFSGWECEQENLIDVAILSNTVQHSNYIIKKKHSKCSQMPKHPVYSSKVATAPFSPYSSMLVVH